MEVSTEKGILGAGVTETQQDNSLALVSESDMVAVYFWLALSIRANAMPLGMLPQQI